MTDHDLLARFESIGRNCEFGFVQTASNVDAISLLRWAGAPQSVLISALASRFEGLMSAAVPEPPNPDRLEWWLTCARYGFVFHTGRGSDKYGCQEAAAAFRPHATRLASKLLDDIRDAEKIFLYSDATLRDPREAEPLWQEIRKIGPDATLLVVCADPSRCGTVEIIERGVVAGYVGYLTEEGAANRVDVPLWLPMLRRVLEITQ